MEARSDVYLSPRAVSLRPVLLALFRQHADEGLTADDLDAWQERRGIRRVERIRLVRDLVDDGEVVKDGDVWRVAPPKPVEPPQPTSVAAARPPSAKVLWRSAMRFAADPSPESPRPAPVAVAPVGPLPFADVRGTIDRAKPLVLHLVPASEVRPARMADRVVLGTVPEVPSITEAQAETMLFLAPGSLRQPPVRVIPVPPREALTETTAATALVAPEPPREPAPTTVADRVLARIRQAPATSTMLCEEWPDVPAPTIRGRLSKLASMGLVERSLFGMYSAVVTGGLK